MCRRNFSQIANLDPELPFLDAKNPFFLRPLHLRFQPQLRKKGNQPLCLFYDLNRILGYGIFLKCLPSSIPQYSEIPKKVLDCLERSNPQNRNMYPRFFL